MVITKSNKHELSLDHMKPNEKMDAHFATLDSLMKLLSWILKSQSPHYDLALLGTHKHVSQLLE